MTPKIPFLLLISFGWLHPDSNAPKTLIRGLTDAEQSYIMAQIRKEGKEWYPEEQSSRANSEISVAATKQSSSLADHDRKALELLVSDAPAYMPYTYAVVQATANQLGINDKIRVSYLEDDKFKYILGSHTSVHGSSLMIGRLLPSYLTYNEFLASVSHEMGHIAIKNHNNFARHDLFNTQKERAHLQQIAAASTIGIGTIGSIWKIKRPLALIAAIPIIAAGGFASYKGAEVTHVLHTMRQARAAEFAADEFSHRLLGNPGPAISGLKKADALIKKAYLDAIPDSIPSHLDKFQATWWCQPLIKIVGEKRAERLLATHPTTAQRLAHLEKIAANVPKNNPH